MKTANQQAYVGQSVQVNSDQTSKYRGTIAKIEYDRVWGPQYLVEFADTDMGTEYFWMDERELTFIQSYR